MPLAQADVDDHALTVDIGDLQGDDLGNPEAGGIGCHDDDAVDQVRNSLEELYDLSRTQDHRELSFLPGIRYVLDGPVLAESDAI